MKKEPELWQITNRSVLESGLPVSRSLFSNNENCLPAVVEINKFDCATADTGLTKTNKGSLGECSAWNREGSPMTTEVTGSGSRIVVVKACRTCTVDVRPSRTMRGLE